MRPGRHPLQPTDQCSTSARDPIDLAERVLEMLDQGRFTATYKYAVLLALIDLCLENVTPGVVAPGMVTTRQLAEKVVQIYWPQTRRHGERALRQSGGGRDSQAEIVRAIERFRDAVGPGHDLSSEAARRDAPQRWERLVRTVEWKLIEMPLPRLQVVGNEDVPVLYRINWGKHPDQRQVTRYQCGERGPFDNRILLLPGVPEALVRLNNLLRPLIQQQWATKVAELNRLDQHELGEFLFGVSRTSLERVRAPLCELQEQRCFYCRERFAATNDKRPDVDHFVPWARYPDNGIHNLVAAHARCNERKRAFLAAAPHVIQWTGRNWRDDDTKMRLATIARDIAWDAHPERTHGVARSIYLHLPEDTRLWLSGSEFEPIRMDVVAEALRMDAPA
jgi:5-methylcytosine-specific restriction endonuclease McrA